MSALLAIYLQQFLVFALVLTRISGLFLVAPVFSSPSIPMKIRAFLAMGMALVLTPTQWPASFAAPRNVIELAALMAQEIALGLSLAMSVMILFSGIQLAGQLISHLGGLALGDVFDPGAGTNVPVVSQLLRLLTIAIFLLTGGHRMLLQALLDMFLTMPVGQVRLSAGIFEGLLEVTILSFETALRAAAPVIVALLLSMIVLGLISRTLPQLNILAVGFSINTTVMLATLMLTIGGMLWVFQEQTASVVESMTRWILFDPAS